MLLVDDNVDAVTVLQMLLENAGYDAHIALSGTEAVREALRLLPDIAFLDIGLPDMDGYEIAQRLRKEPKLGSIKLVALTGWGTESDRKHALEAGFDRHLTKPVDSGMIRRTIEALVRD